MGTQSTPLSKDDCMNDGWRNYGDKFKTEG
jgi:hypothetical protein